MAASPADITVVICTRNRAESLRQTLDCLAQADKTGLRCEIVIVDNGGSDHTPEIARAAIPDLPIHYLVESRPGKNHAANRALADAPLGALVVFLDDDMSPHPEWFKGVKAIADRWPDCDLFTGQSYVIWPGPDVPDWCRHPRLRGWAYSVMGGTADASLADGRWFSGNHFWLRSRVLQDGRRFGIGQGDADIQIYFSEPQFMLQLTEDGFQGRMGPNAVCGHRLQPELLKLATLKERARRAGRGFAVARLQPYKRKVKQARLFRVYPVVSRLFCAASVAGWAAARLIIPLHPVRAERIAWQLQAIQRLATYREYLRIAGQMDEYRVFGRRQNP